MKTSNLTTRDFDAVFLKLASPETIKEWSYGEVTKPETINYRTQRSEKQGLFDEKIFGPEKDYECYCGKYRGIRYKGIVCEKCGVEVTRAIVRRERMGHIELASPVSHVWFLRSVPSRMSLLLGVKSGDLEKVIYFGGFIITKIDEEERKRVMGELQAEYKAKVKTLQDEKAKEALKEAYIRTKREIDGIVQGLIIDEDVYNRLSLKYVGMFEAEIGAEAIYNIFKTIDLNKLSKELEKELETAKGAKREKLNKRLSLVSSMISSNIRPEWMFMTVIPVLPPALRPMVALDGGRHATSDVNDLYRRVINRNNRLKKLIKINAPHVILRNEKRILQEAVDALIDNSIRRSSNSYALGASRRPLKSLSDNLKSKQGIFRQNLLGKRVDYSARSVIVVGPTLALDECGIPKQMALELFRPFVISKLLNQELAYNIRGANKLIDDGIPEVWAILEEVIEGKYVLLNRAPTLHRLGIQAFRPVLIEGKAIQVHPLICPAFNADFDGDQMAVHVPLSDEAQLEAREIMSATKNILKPGTGKPVVASKMLDIVLGCYWMTKIIDGKPGEGSMYPNPNYAISAHDYGAVDLRARIKVLPTDSMKYEQFEGEVFETSVGRLLFNSVLPKDFPYVNEEVDNGMMQNIVDNLIEHYGIDAVPGILDKIKTFGFRYASYAGITWGLDEIVVPEEKNQVIETAKKKAAEVEAYYQEGLLSNDERYSKVIETWHQAKDDVEGVIAKNLDPQGSVFDMWKSGARGSLKQINVMSGMKGLIVNNQGQIIDFPITTSAKEGHTPLEYFITAYGSRKGLTDTALNTATAGYLTRKLFDVAQDVVVTEADCGTKRGVIARKESLGGLTIPLERIVRGRYVSADVVDQKGDTLFKKGHFITEEDAKLIEDSGIEEVEVKSPMTCETKRGVCQKCYGMDLGTNREVELGEAVGTIAAQAIGEPGTQLTMRTFHQGGTASKGGDIVSGLPRVIEIFERRNPKNVAVLSKTDGVVQDIVDDGRNKKIIILTEATARSSKSKKETEEYTIHYLRTPVVAKGEEVKKGQFLTDGSANLRELFQLAGTEATQNYIIREISKIYELQGASISRKHIEVMIKQMFSRVRVINPGDSEFTRGDVVEVAVIEEVNEKLKNAGKEPAKVEQLIKGISEVALTRDSFLSAASFQHTTKILIDAAIRGKKDRLEGLKENVMIGNLIPAGTGFDGSPKRRMIVELQEELEDTEYSYE